MPKRRPKKVFRLNYFDGHPDLQGHVTILGEPAEVRVGAGPKQFVSVRSQGITLSPGQGNQVNIQGLPNNLKFGGLLSSMPFPLYTIPSTAATPMPQYTFSPPMSGILPTLRMLQQVSQLFLALQG